MKKKLDERTKVKLIYSGELVVFAIAFLVIGILEICKVIQISDTFLNIFKWVTIFGSSWLIIDFVWALVSKKRRQKICLLDKAVILPGPMYIIVLDILLFSGNETVLENRGYFIGGIFLFISLVYAFQGIYHWFYPLESLFEDDEKDKNPENEENKPEEEKEAK